MGENVPQSIEVPVPLDMFGSLVTEMAPADLPAGVSPDNQDIVYLPGSVASRPCLGRLYNQLPVNASITYAKTFVQPNGIPINLILDSNGGLWREDVTITPGVLTHIGSVTPGCFCNSVTAFGREYLAFHDGINGVDIPLAYNGLHLDRVSQDGPGAPPNMTNYQFLPATIQNVGAGGAINIASVATADPQTVEIIRVTRYGEIDTTITLYQTLLFTTATPHGLGAGSIITVAGTALASVNGAKTVFSIISATQFKVSWGSSVIVALGAAGTITSILPSISRQANVITATTLNPHNFAVGFRVNISGYANPNIVGITTIARLNGVCSVTTAATHGLQSGETVNISGSADASMNVQTTVFSIVDATHFTYLQTGFVDVAASAGGNVQDVINGTYTIQSIPTPSTFTYLQVGINTTNNNVGTAKIIGRVGVGTRSCVVLFQTRNGLITGPSTPVTVSSNGDQSLLISNIPLGPDNVVARVLAFTGAFGGNYFYIPTPSFLNGVSQSTQTVLPDNTSTSLIVDFADVTLFDSIAIDVKGNNLFALETLGHPIGFFYYASRLVAWGEKNKVPNFTNLGFDGGYLNFGLQSPLGWTVETAGGILDSEGDFGIGWRIVGDGTANPIGRLSQPADADFYGVTILSPSKSYEVSCFLVLLGIQNAGNVVFELYSASSGGVLGTASFACNTLSEIGKFYSVNFDTALPISIPSDLVLRMYAINMQNGQQVVIDEIEIIPLDNPNRRSFSMSYVGLPDSFDGETGRLGADNDDSLIQTAFENRGQLNFLTLKGMHYSKDSGNSEPSNWAVSSISNRCGGCSPRCCDISENFAAWLSSPTTNPPTGRGVYVYTGGSVYKVSQEVQSLFDSMNKDAAQTAWLTIDPTSKRILVGIPSGSATAPNLIIPLDYRELDTASNLSDRPPVHISFQGRMICSDLSRKWTRWNVAANCGVMVQTSRGTEFCIGGGTGVSPSQQTGLSSRANIYRFDEAKLTDDDYGQVTPYYVTYFFVQGDVESQIPVGFHRKLFKRYFTNMTGVGQLAITPYGDTLANPQATLPMWPLQLAQFFDIGDGMNLIADRAAFKIASIPLPGQTDNSFNTGKFGITMCQEPVAPIRFGAI